MSSILDRLFNRQSAALDTKIKRGAFHAAKSVANSKVARSVAMPFLKMQAERKMHKTMRRMGIIGRVISMIAAFAVPAVITALSRKRVETTPAPQTVDVTYGAYPTANTPQQGM